jgi:DNA repair protein RadC
MPKETKAVISEEPLYLGHRARLRTRFSVDEGKSMPDYELLELLLTISIPRRDVKPLAKALITKFKNLDGVINASPEELLSIEGVSKNTVGLLKIVSAINLQAGGRKLRSRDNTDLSFDQELESYYQSKFAEVIANTVLVAFFNDDAKLLKEKSFKCHFPDASDFNMQELIMETIASGTTEIIIMRRRLETEDKSLNSDKYFIAKIIKTLNAMDVIISDYVIFDDKNYLSFKKEGIIKVNKKRALLKR